MLLNKSILCPTRGVVRLLSERCGPAASLFSPCSITSAAAARIGLDESVSEPKLGEATARHERIISLEAPQNHGVGSFAKLSRG